MSDDETIIAILLKDARLERYLEAIQKEKMSVETLLAACKIKHIWSSLTKRLKMKTGHATRLRRFLERHETEKKNAKPKVLEDGIRVLVRTTGSGGEPCLLEGRLVATTQDEQGSWTMMVNAPLTNPKRHRFKWTGTCDTQEFLIPKYIPEEDMGVGARVVGAFCDASMLKGWAWYEGDVVGFENSTIKVRYTDGMVWEHKYPPKKEVLDISQSEKFLSFQQVSLLNADHTTVDAIPTIMIRPKLSKFKKTDCDVDKVDKRLKQGMRVLTRVRGTNMVSCLLEGRLLKAMIDGNKKKFIEVESPIAMPNPTKRYFEWRGMEAKEYLIPPPCDAYDDVMGVGASVVGVFGDESVPGGWAWYEGKVVDWRPEIKAMVVHYVDGTTWPHTFKTNRQMLDIKHSETWLNKSIVSSLLPKDIPIITISPPTFHSDLIIKAGTKNEQENEVKADKTEDQDKKEVKGDETEDQDKKEVKADETEDQDKKEVKADEIEDQDKKEVKADETEDQDKKEVKADETEDQDKKEVKAEENEDEDKKEVKVEENKEEDKKEEKEDKPQELEEAKSPTPFDPSFNPFDPSGSSNPFGEFVFAETDSSVVGMFTAGETTETKVSESLLLPFGSPPPSPDLRNL